MQRAVEQVHVAERSVLYMRRPRHRDAGEHPGAGRRRALAASLALLKLARCRAALDGRDFVTPDDVKRSPCRRWRTGSRCARSCGCSGCDAEDVVRELPRRVSRRRQAEASPTGDGVTRARAKLARLRGARRRSR